MPLPKPVARKIHHSRTITCDGFEREDGLWDIEAHMQDVKHYSVDNNYRGELQPGDPIHNMYIRLTLTDQRVIEDIEARIVHSPFEVCPNIGPDYKKLVGIKIGAGWLKQVRERVGGRMGCTHLSELLPVMATTAFQTIFPILAKRHGVKTDKDIPSVVNGCHAGYLMAKYETPED